MYYKFGSQMKDTPETNDEPLVSDMEPWRPDDDVRLLLLAGLALLAGCAQPPKATSTARLEAARQEAALEANRRGDTYVRHGELDNAARVWWQDVITPFLLESQAAFESGAIDFWPKASFNFGELGARVQGRDEGQLPV